MFDKTLALTLAVVLAAPFMVASANTTDTFDENATWGLCEADEVNEQGDEASDGAVEDTPVFSNLTEEDCENATAPWNGTPGKEYAPKDPGEPDDNPDEDDNPGDDQDGQPE